MKEKEQDHWYKVGQFAGLEEASNYLLEKATQFFKNGNDATAATLRCFSKDLKERAEKVHPRTKP